MLFIETPIFTKLVAQFLSEDSYAKLQQTLISQPKVGRIIRGSGGLRKMRWQMPGSGKRGGLRLIYYWDTPNDTLYMLAIYKKNQRTDLTPAQIRILSQLVKEWLK